MTVKQDGILAEEATIPVYHQSSLTAAELIQLAQNTKHLIAVSASYSAAGMNPSTKNGADTAVLDLVITLAHAAGNDVTVISAQLPYDAAHYTNADAIVVAYGARGMNEDPRDAEGSVSQYGPNVPAAIYTVLFGLPFEGRLPIDLPALDENGILNADGVVKARNGSESPLFEAGKKYTVTVAAFGYPELVFAYEKLGVWPAIAGENGTTYVSLFDTIVTEEWNPLWQDYIGAVMGEDASPAMTAALQGSVTSNLHGEEAIAAFADGGYAFDCHFINGAQSLTFKDNTVTILKTDGTQETHTYEYQGKINIGEGETMQYQGAEISMAFPVDVYKSTDEAG